MQIGCQSKQDYELVWSDEFDYVGLPDTHKWNYDTVGNAWGWGNNELQFYTTNRTENAFVENGILSITARKDSGYIYPYTSSRLTTKGKGDWLYGRIEIMAKIPGGTGLWPAIWMLPTDWEYGGWPASGEIDIMEHVGYDPDSIHFTVHTQDYNHTLGTQRSSVIFFPEGEKEFHLYAVEWEEDKCAFFLDEKKVFTFKKESDNFAQWPFNKRYHLLLNVAVGGNWGGRFGVDDSIFPRSMEIDYVRVYQKP